MKRPRPHLPPASCGAIEAFSRSPLAAGLIQASHALYYGFATLDWQAAGLDGVTIGALWALGVIAEIALFAVADRLRVGPAILLSIGAAGAVLRWGVMAFDPPLPLLAGCCNVCTGSRSAPPIWVPSDLLRARRRSGSERLRKATWRSCLAW